MTLKKYINLRKCKNCFFIYITSSISHEGSTRFIQKFDKNYTNTYDFRSNRHFKFQLIHYDFKKIKTLKKLINEHFFITIERSEIVHIGCSDLMGGHIQNAI